MGFSRFIIPSPKTIRSILKSPSIPSPLLGSLQSLTTPPQHSNHPIFLPNLPQRFIHTPTSSTPTPTTEDIDKLCKLLTKHSGNPSGVASSLTESGVSVSPQLVEEILKKLSNAGALALSFFQWAEKQNGFIHTTEIYNALIEPLGKIKQFKLIWNLVGTMKDKGLLTRETFALIMRRYARAKKTQEAVETFDKMEKFGLKPELSDFNRLLDTLSKSKHIKKAQEVFDEMKKRRFMPDLKTYSIILEGWGQALNVVLMKEVHREMRDEGFEPDAVVYGIIINSYCKAGKYEEAIELFNEMEGKNCKPTPHIYCSLINGLGSAKKLNEALDFLERSKVSGFQSDIATYNAVVASYCWSKQFKDAYQVIDEMTRCGVSSNSRTYDIILHHLIKLRRMEEAYSLFQKMGGKGGCEPCLSTYTIMLGMFCNEERVDMALKIWDQMKDKGIIPTMHMFSSLINAFCNENKLDDACNYFQEMLDMGIRPPGNLYDNLKKALLDAGKKDTAINLGLKLDKVRSTPLVG